MINARFRKPDKNPLVNDVDFVNLYYPFKNIFNGINKTTIKSDTEICLPDPVAPTVEDSENIPTFILQQDNLVKVTKNNSFDIPMNTIISKFMLLSAIKFEGDSFAAMSYVSYYLRKNDVPYVRIGSDYFKIIQKNDRYGSIHKQLKSWKKEEIKDDHSKSIFKLIYKYDDFCIEPDNISFSPMHQNCYNIYSPFPHTPSNDTITEEDIPKTINLLKHIFGIQFEIGLKYLKILYENPKQILPVLVLVSNERETGKTTFLNWIHMLFGENSVLINPQELTSNFNYGYANKNIIMIDESVIEKSTSVERLKSLATAKTISVSQKHVSQYSIPFYGKIILCTNKEKDFMRIDEEEVRFWIRKIKVIAGIKNINIEKDIFIEIPKFLKYLIQQPAIDMSKSRMVFTKDEIQTDELTAVKNESKSGLFKELEILIDDYFFNNNAKELEVAVIDIKDKWFRNNHQISMAYIRKVIKNEMKYQFGNVKKYYPFDSEVIKTGRTIIIKNTNWNQNVEEILAVAGAEYPF